MCWLYGLGSLMRTPSLCCNIAHCFAGSKVRWPAACNLYLTRRIAYPGFPVAERPGHVAALLRNTLVEARAILVSVVLIATSVLIG